MADLILKQNNGRRGVAPPRIDLTPMVDLGFLLITFFMFTTTLSESKSMPLNMPAPETDKGRTVFTEESTTTLIPTGAHMVAYYNGEWSGPDAVKVCKVKDVTNLMLDRKKMAAALPEHLSAEAHKMHVIIKPNDDCVYDDVVQMLDAMLIADVPYYAITDLSEVEKESLVTVVPATHQ